MATLYKQVNEPPPPLHQVKAGVPDWLEGVANKALAKRPEARYQRASEMAEALRAQHALNAPRVDAGQAGARPADRTPGLVPPVAERGEGKRRPGGVVPILAGAIAVLFLALLAGGAYLLGIRRSARPIPATAVVIVVTSAPGGRYGDTRPIPTPAHRHGQAANSHADRQAQDANPSADRHPRMASFSPMGSATTEQVANGV